MDTPWKASQSLMRCALGISSAPITQQQRDAIYTHPWTRYRSPLHRVTEPDPPKMLTIPSAVEDERFSSICCDIWKKSHTLIIRSLVEASVDSLTRYPGPLLKPCRRSAAPADCQARSSCSHSDSTGPRDFCNLIGSSSQNGLAPFVIMMRDSTTV